MSHNTLFIQKCHLGYLKGMERSFVNERKRHQRQASFNVQDKSLLLQNFSRSSNFSKWEVRTKNKSHGI